MESSALSPAGDPRDRVRISDAEREAVVARLNAATGEGRLTLVEFTERSGLAYQARTAAELEPLVADLPPASAVARPGAAEPVRQHTPVGAVKRSGRWRIDRDTVISTTVGAVKLDLSQAEVAAAEVALRVRATVGSVKVWVPRGVRVEVTGTSTVGSRQVEEDWHGTSPGAPLLRLAIDTKLGSVKVYRV